jgi:hypothetical protein
MKIGEHIKVHLPGESPWAEVMATYEDGTWDGRISNRLFGEMSDIERARFTKDHFDTAKALPRLHDYKQDQVVRFCRETTADYSIWVPATGATSEIAASIAESEMNFLGVKVKVHVLSDGRRIIEKDDFERVLAVLLEGDSAGERQP